MTKTVEQFNELFGQELGRNRLEQPLYAWKFAPQLRHIRYVWGEDHTQAFIWKYYPLEPLPQASKLLISSAPSDPGLWIPQRPFEEVPSFPFLKDRWCIAMCQDIDDRMWHRLFGQLAVWQPGGYYVPTDVVMKPGFRPTLDQTWHWIGQIRLTRMMPATTYEQKVESEMEIEDRHNFNTLVDMIENENTAFGSKPGSRSGGVSLPGKEAA